MKKHTPEQKAKYMANRRAKYHSDPEYRAKVNARNLERSRATKDENNERRRQKWRTDPDWRNKQKEEAAKRRSDPEFAEEIKIYQREWRYGMSHEQYIEMWDAQEGLCAICRFRIDIVVDHCHTTGKVRGLLCRGCNAGLGHFEEKPERLAAAAEYLRAHSDNK
jgi:hypothetical protein